MRVQAPHPRVIELGLQRALLLVHPAQAQLHARVNASGDEGLDLQTFPGQEVLVVPITIVWSDASRSRSI